jgi:hypothetical protein
VCFDGDIIRARAEGGERGDCGEDGVDCVAAGVGEGGFGMFSARKNARRMGRDFGHTSKVVGGGGEVGSGGGAFVGGGS